MKCRGCARDIPEDSRFCLFCGVADPAAGGRPDRSGRRLGRSRADRRIAGVCGGVAEYFDLDPTVVRLVWVLAVILPVPRVPACLLYLAAWILLPQSPEPSGRPVGVTLSCPAP